MNDHSLGSEPTEKLIKLLNGTFDVMNTRHAKEAINVANWHEKSKILESMLKLIDLTEATYSSAGKGAMKMFSSVKTLHGWRLSIQSTIDLVEELFNTDYNFVLTAKWNQDALEVCISG